MLTPNSIVHLNTQWLNTIGGPTTYVKNLCEQQRYAGKLVKVFAPDNKADWDISGHLLYRTIKILSGLLKLRPNVVHIHGSMSYIPPAIIYRILMKLINTRVVVIFTFHTQPVIKNFIESFKLSRSYTGIRGWLSNLLLQSVDQMSVVSESIAKNLFEHTSIKSRRFSVIGSGVNLDKSNFKQTAMHNNIEKKAFKVIQACSIGVFSWDWKIAGHFILIEAVAILRTQYKRQLIINIIGDGIGRDLIESAIKKHKVTDLVKLHGYLKNPGDLLSKCDIYIHTGLNEGCPLSIIEAIGSEIPVFAVNEGGNPELIKHNITGYLFEPDPLSLASLLNKYLEGKLLAPVEFKAFKMVQKNYNWTIIEQKYTNIYSNK